MIKLRPLPRFDLSTVFARDMGNNKVKHYTLAAHSPLIAHFSEKTPQDIMKEYLAITDPSEEVVFLPQMSDRRTVETKDVSAVILKDHLEVLTSLNKMKDWSMIHQFNIWTGSKLRVWLDPLLEFLNKRINHINSIMRYNYWKDTDFKTLERFEYLNRLAKLWQIPNFRRAGYTRSFYICRFLSIAFMEGEEKAAADLLIADLKLLNDRGLIMGHQILPQILILADTVGIGKLPYAMFCSIFLDDKKLKEYFSAEEWLDPPKLLLSRLGVKTESGHAGDLNHLNESPYEIEIVDVNPSYDKNYETYLQNYKDNVEEVNRVAKGAKKQMEEFEVLNKTSRIASEDDISVRSLAISADIVNKDTKVGITLEEAYRKNQDR